MTYGLMTYLVNLCQIELARELYVFSGLSKNTVILTEVEKASR